MTDDGFRVLATIPHMSQDRSVPTDSGRRQFLRAVVSGAVVGAVAPSAFNLGAPEKLSAQTILSPDAALQQLVDGNQRFASNRLTSIGHDLAAQREQTAGKQEPFAAVLACADSRVPVELVFDQTIGHLFVTRIAGNIVTPEIIGSLEYGVAELGIKALLVLGHASCGAVKAAMKAEPVPGQISSLYPHLQQAVEQSGGNLDKAVEVNAKIQAELLRSSSTVIRDAVKTGKLKVESGVYDLATGKVRLN